MTEKPKSAPRSLSQAYLAALRGSSTLDAIKDQSQQMAKLMEGVSVKMPAVPRPAPSAVLGQQLAIAAPIMPAPIVAKPDRMPELVANQGRTNELLAEQNQHLASQLQVLADQVEIQRKAAESARKDTKVALVVAISFGALSTIVAIVGVVLTVTVAR